MTEEQLQQRLDALSRTRDVYMRVYHGGLLGWVSQVSALGSRIHIFVTEGEIEGKRAAFVREFGPDRLEHYFVNHDGDLGVAYRHDDVDVTYYDADREARLAKLSGGKCHIAQEAIESVTEQIICAMDD